MKVDTVAAMQGCINVKEKFGDSRQYRIATDVQRIMNQISTPGKYGRRIFDLNQFFSELGSIDFGNDWYPAEIALTEIMKYTVNAIGTASYENEDRP